MAYNYEWPYTDSELHNDDWLLHKMKEVLAEMGEVKKEFSALKEYVDNYFANLNIQAEVDRAFSQLAASGYFDQYFRTTRKGYRIACFGDKSFGDSTTVGNVPALLSVFTAATVDNFSVMDAVIAENRELGHPLLIDQLANVDLSLYDYIFVSAGITDLSVAIDLVSNETDTHYTIPAIKHFMNSIINAQGRRGIVYYVTPPIFKTNPNGYGLQVAICKALTDMGVLCLFDHKYYGIESLAGTYQQHAWWLSQWDSIKIEEFPVENINSLPAPCISAGMSGAWKAAALPAVLSTSNKPFNVMLDFVSSAPGSISINGQYLSYYREGKSVIYAGLISNSNTITITFSDSVDVYNAAVTDSGKFGNLNFVSVIYGENQIPGDTRPIAPSYALEYDGYKALFQLNYEQCTFPVTVRIPIGVAGGAQRPFLAAIEKDGVINQVHGTMVFDDTGCTITVPNGTNGSSLFINQNFLLHNKGEIMPIRREKRGD